MNTHKRPTYSLGPAYTTTGKLRPHMFSIYEQRDGQVEWISTMSNRGDRLNEILKRGIPLDDAMSLFYGMDE